MMKKTIHKSQEEAFRWFSNTNNQENQAKDSCTPKSLVVYDFVL